MTPHRHRAILLVPMAIALLPLARLTAAPATPLRGSRQVVAAVGTPTDASTGETAYVAAVHQQDIALTASVRHFVQLVKHPRLHDQTWTTDFGGQVVVWRLVDGAARTTSPPAHFAARHAVYLDLLAKMDNAAAAYLDAVAAADPTLLPTGDERLAQAVAGARRLARLDAQVGLDSTLLTAAIAKIVPSGPAATATPKPATTSGAEGAADAPHKDKNCSDFATQAEAQAYFVANGGGPTNNVDGLDRDHNGQACESLP